MQRLYVNVPISRAAAVNFALLIVPLSLIFLAIIVQLTQEIEHIGEEPLTYHLENDLVHESGPIRRSLHFLRSLSPFYQQETEVEGFLRDARLLFALIWLTFTLLVLWVAYSLTRSLQSQLSALGDAISQLADHDLSKPINIRGNANVQALSNELESLRVMLDQTGQQQVQFLSHVAHEIKTPLASIREGIKLMNDELLGEINADQREVTEIISKNSRALQASLERLFDYNRAVALTSAEDRVDVQISELVEETLEHQALAIKSKDLQIQTKINHAVAEVNYSQMLTVFENLLSNAIRYSPHGGIISIEARAQGDTILIDIQDEGPGIPVAQRRTVFNAFFTGSPPKGDELKGSGLGLSIARQYVELHQGDIELLDTSEGRLAGALFRVTLNHATS